MSIISTVYKGSVYGQKEKQLFYPGKKKKKKGASTQGKMCRIAKSILGYGSMQGVSHFELIVKCLSLRGVQKPKGVSDKEFALKNYQLLESVKPAKKATSSSDKSNNEYLSSREFLQSFEWRKLRMEALKLNGARCQCCGASPANGAVMNVDHIKPRKTHPELALEITNLQVLCEDCNHGKGNWDSTDWRNNS